MLENPYQKTWEAFQEPLSRLIDEKMQAQITKHDESRDLDVWEEQNAHLLYEFGEDGQVLRDIHGYPKPTSYGEAFIKACERVQEEWSNRFPDQPADPHYVWTMANMATEHLVPQEEETPEQTPEQASVEKKEKFLDTALKKAAHSPSSGAYAEGGVEDPGEVSRTELESMFTDAGKKAGM
jgi:hypothetical protein